MTYRSERRHLAAASALLRRTVGAKCGPYARPVTTSGGPTWSAAAAVGHNLPALHAVDRRVVYCRSECSLSPCVAREGSSISSIVNPLRSASERYGRGVTDRCA